MDIAVAAMIWATSLAVGFAVFEFQQRRRAEQTRDEIRDGIRKALCFFHWEDVLQNRSPEECIGCLLNAERGRLRTSCLSDTRRGSGHAKHEVGAP